MTARDGSTAQEPSTCSTFPIALRVCFTYWRTKGRQYPPMLALDFQPVVKLFSILRLAGPFVQRADLHGIPGLTSALAACVARNTSAPGTGESEA